MEQLERQDSKEVDIKQGSVEFNLLPHIVVNAMDVSFGACVIGISKEDKNIFSIGHFQPGEIVTELKGLCSRSVDKHVCVYQYGVQGKIGDLHSNGRKLSAEKVKKLFRERDQRYW